MLKIILSVLISFNILADANPLDTLLERIKQDRIEQNKELKKREQEFLKKKSEQQGLLKKANNELAALEKESERLLKIFNVNEQELSKLETEKNNAVGILGEMFGVVKQIAGDFRGQFQSSVVSAQFPDREKFMSELAEKKKLPEVTQLEQLWFAIQKEMTESGKVVRFTSEVVSPDGKRAEKIVTRVGSFNLTADGKYLNYLSETGQLVELGRQPEGQWLSRVKKFEQAKDGIESFGIDPSRGTLLSMLVQAPSLSERLAQGGVVGYVILTLLVLGLLLVAERFYTLNKEEKALKAQLNSDNPDPTNPLGQIMQVFNKYKGVDTETLELKIDETILQAVPKIERGIGTLSILAKVAPLLGLLGTVTGMIQTFQSITLFGTGDPKLMAGGISSALITTVLGLICAIPLLLLHNLLSNKSKSLIQILEEQAAGMLSAKAEGEAVEA